MNGDKLLKAADKFCKFVVAHIDLRVPRSFQFHFQNEFINSSNEEIFKKDYEKWLKKNANILAPLFENQMWWEYRNGNLLSLDYNYSIISKISKPHQVTDRSFDLSSEAILQPEGVIPTLWLYNGKIVHPSAISDQNPILGHYYFILEALAFLFNRSLDNKNFIKETEGFLEKHKNKIDQFKKMSQGGEITLLGTGAQGIAFQLSPNLVIKFFTSLEGYQEAKNSIERLHQHPELARTEAMMYDFGIVGTFSNSPVYYYIMEKMQPVRGFTSGVSSDILHIINIVVGFILENKEFWRSVKRKIHDPKNHKEIKMIVLEQAAKFSNILKNDEIAIYSIDRVERKIPNLNKKWLASLVEEIIMKYLTDRADLHTGNLGVTNYGEFRYFDPAHPAYTSNINT